MDTWGLLLFLIFLIAIGVGGFFFYIWYKNRNTTSSTQCSSSSDCEVDNICVSGKCVTGCNSNINCRSGEICDKTNRCVTGCRSSSDCPSSYTCDVSSGKCQPTGVECKASSDCKSSMKQCYNGTCVACLVDSDCGTNQMCSSTHECIVKTQCSSPSECNGKPCVDGKCVDCSVDGDCVIGDVCTENKCVPGCGTDDSRCPTGYVCSNGNCIVGCHTDGQCHQGQICSTNSTCISGCRVDNQCSAGSKCINATCIINGCLNNSDCTNGEVCGNNNVCMTPAPTNICDPSLPNYTIPKVDGKTLYTIANLNTGLVIGGLGMTGVGLVPLNCTDEMQKYSLQPSGDSDGSFYITLNAYGTTAYIGLSSAVLNLVTDIGSAFKFTYQSCGLLVTSDKQYMMIAESDGNANNAHLASYSTAWKGTDYKKYIWILSSTSC